MNEHKVVSKTQKTEIKIWDKCPTEKEVLNHFLEKDGIDFTSSENDCTLTRYFKYKDIKEGRIHGGMIGAISEWTKNSTNNSNNYIIEYEWGNSEPLKDASSSEWKPLDLRCFRNYPKQTMAINEFGKEQFEKSLTKRYYDLIEFEDKKTGIVFHIPVPIFYRNSENAHHISMNISDKKRDNNFFTCPLCKTKGFYAGICSTCQEVFDGDDTEEKNRIGFTWEDSEKYEFSEKSKKIRKGMILSSIRKGNGIPKKYDVVYVKSEISHN